MKRFEFHDTEELSHALQHTDVSAIQISKGRFHGELAQYCVGGWSVQHVKFNEGRACCRGSSPSQLYAFVIPLALSDNFRLLGQEVTDGSFGFYAPRSEHGDTTAAGASEDVLIPPPGVIEQFERDLELILPQAGSFHHESHVQQSDSVRGVLDDLHRAARTDSPLLSQAEASRALSDR